MNIQSCIQILDRQLSYYSWYSHSSIFKNNRLVVYVNTMNRDMFDIIPNKIAEYQVLIHYSDSIKFANEAISNNSSILKDELLLMEKESCSSIVSDIFFEVHDGDDAVTNLSVKFPRIRKSMENLYNRFGFDTIYKELV